MSSMRRTVPKNSLGPFIPTLSMCLGSLGTCHAFYSISSESSILPEELANQSVRLKEEQLRREEEKVSAIYSICDSH
jgi:hypothetical protein